jgi:His/Glu/Gln/Arg/opine family amino acid ABC transporter permease subunit
MTSLWTSQKFRRYAIQVAFVVIVVVVIVASVIVGRHNIMSQGMATGFGFLKQTTGWTLGFSVFEVGPRSTYTQILLAGLLNTVVVGLLTLVFASLLGTVIALMRVSSNTLMRIVGGAYVEIFRNIPIILQVVFWYAILTHLPSPREAYQFGSAIVSNRGIMLPA